MRTGLWGGRVALLAMALPAGLPAQQVPDTAFRPTVSAPAFAPGRGPVVLIDEAHFNFHTAGDRYLPFARLLERDGFVVRPSRARFDTARLGEARVLVIANALADTGEWVLPARPAFTSAEIAAVREWVRAGGSLLLIADHMPFPGVAESLAAAFGIGFTNGFALGTGDGGIAGFRKADGSLRTHPVTEGIDSVRSFTGQAFRLTGPGVPLMILDTSMVNLLPTRAWEFTAATPRTAAAGMLQGALVEFGRGRVAVFGEAAMFTAQLGGPNRNPMGMNHPTAPQNARFALNVVRWLARPRSS